MKYFLTLLLFSFQLQAAIHHQLSVQIIPESSYIMATDELMVVSGETLEVKLNSGLILSYVAGAMITGIKSEGLYTTYTLHSIHTSIRLEYEGKLKTVDESGITPDGISLFADNYWYPHSENLVTFELQVTMPNNWIAVSQGVESEPPETQIWRELRPQKSIYLIANKFYDYHKVENGKVASVYLREKDDQLAEKFLSTTHQYLQLYSEMLGEYAYDKFAMIENYWETGFGMPSFTLLGPTVARLPFIFYSSYPHEILHNWWGNSVYVDYKNGNWCEGLTTYLADHYLQQQRGTDTSYRQNALKKYADFVSSNNEYPLREFVWKEDNRAEAIGYSKGMMLFHMLKVRFGEKLFLESLRHFYKNNKFQVARYEDIQESFETVTKTSLHRFFTQWVDWSGAPKIELSDVTYSDGSIHFTLTQHEKNIYGLYIPVEIETQTGTETHNIILSSKSKQFSFSVKNPKRLKIDPQFDLFRKVDFQEVAPGLSTILGTQQSVTIVVPNSDTRYQQLAIELQKSLENSQIIMDNQKLPSGPAVILGATNAWLKTIPDHPDYRFYNGELRIKGEDYTDQSVVFVTQQQENPKLYIQAQSGMEVRLAQKLIHYGKYSVIAFEGEQNTLKASWEIYQSPLIFNF
jgi:hypothetical protein